MKWFTGFILSFFVAAVASGSGEESTTNEVGPTQTSLEDDDRKFTDNIDVQEIISATALEGSGEQEEVEDEDIGDNSAGDSILLFGPALGGIWQAIVEQVAGSVIGQWVMDFADKCPWSAFNTDLCLNDEFFPYPTGLVIQILLFLYVFGGLATSADHLCNSMETLCDHWEIPEDVGGASFMAIGSAIPEITVNVISTINAMRENAAVTKMNSELDAADAASHSGKHHKL